MRSVSVISRQLQSSAEIAVQEMLKEIARKTKAMNGTTVLSAEEFMDDGSKIQLTIDIDEDKVSSSRRKCWIYYLLYFISQQIEMWLQRF